MRVAAREPGRTQEARTVERLEDTSRTAGAAPLEISLWNREALPFARDILFIAAVLFYVIGFAYQTAKMQRFGIGVDLGDQQLSSLFSWAVEALYAGRWEFAGVVLAVLLLVTLAGYAKHALRKSRFCRTLTYAIVGASVVLLVAGSATIAWREGSAKADRYLKNLDASSVRLFLATDKPVPELNANREAPASVYILAQTSDMYEILVANSAAAPTQTFLLHRADVALIVVDQQTDRAPKLRPGEYPETHAVKSTPAPDKLSASDSVAPRHSSVRLKV